MKDNIMKWTYNQHRNDRYMGRAFQWKTYRDAVS